MFYRGPLVYQLTVTCLPSLNKGVTLPYLTLPYLTTILAKTRSRMTTATTSSRQMTLPKARALLTIEKISYS